jgi:hypothetical protein
LAEIRQISIRRRFPTGLLWWGSRGLVSVLSIALFILIRKLSRSLL